MTFVPNIQDIKDSVTMIYFFFREEIKLSKYLADVLKLLEIWLVKQSDRSRRDLHFCWSKRFTSRVLPSELAAVNRLHTTLDCVMQAFFLQSPKQVDVKEVLKKISVHLFYKNVSNFEKPFQKEEDYLRVVTTYYNFLSSKYGY